MKHCMLNDWKVDMESFFIWLSLSLTAFVLFILLRDDLLFLQQRRIRALGTVTGHSSQIDEGDRVFSARIAFTDDAGAQRDFVDMVRTHAPEPAKGAVVDIVYPQNRPDKARLPRPWLRLVIYTVVVGMNGILIARLLGFLGN